MQQGNEKQAFDYLYASALAEDGTEVLDKFRWVNAFKRPAHRRAVGNRFSSDGVTEELRGRITIRSAAPSRFRTSRADLDKLTASRVVGPAWQGPVGPGWLDPVARARCPGMSGAGGMYSGAGGTNAAAGSEDLAKATGELGEELRRHLQERIDRGEYGEILVQLASAPSRPAAGQHGRGSRCGIGYPGSGIRDRQRVSRCIRAVAIRAHAR